MRFQNKDDRNNSKMERAREEEITGEVLASAPDKGRKAILMILPIVALILTAALAVLLMRMPRNQEIKMEKVKETPAPTENLVVRPTEKTVAVTESERSPKTTLKKPVTVVLLQSRQLSTARLSTLVQKSAGVNPGVMEAAPELRIDPQMKPGQAGPEELRVNWERKMLAAAAETGSEQSGSGGQVAETAPPDAVSTAETDAALPTDVQKETLPTAAPPQQIQAAGGSSYRPSNTQVYVYGDKVNVRQDASTSSQVLMEVHAGDILEEVETNGTWSRVRLADGFEGYIFSNLLSYNFVEPEHVAVAAAAPALAQEEFQPYYGYLYASNSGINIRSAPSTASDVVGTLFYGDYVTAIAYTGGWFQIQWYNGEVAYVHGDYLQTEAIAQEELTGEIVHEDVSYWAADISANPADYAGGSAVVGMALNYVGSPYVYGASGPDCFDCSGFVQYIYKQMGVYLGRTTYDQVYDGIAVNFGYRNYSNLVPGDILLFAEGTDVYHSGIYIGGGQMVHAGTSATGVIIDDLNLEYYASRLAYVRRVFY